MTNGTKGNTRHQEMVQQADQAVEALFPQAGREKFRLGYHFMPRAGWMNDPNGLIHFQGEYHLFYQHHPYSGMNGPMHWGHAKSGDLIHWEHLPVALAPSEAWELAEQGGMGCWSGSAVDHDGTLTLIYTAHADGRKPEEVQCLAESTDGVVFLKHPRPVIAGAPEEGIAGFRDPKVWRHGEMWYMVLGSGKAGRGRILLYQSHNLLDWEYKGVPVESDGSEGDMWECPDLFPLGDKHVLILSPMNMAQSKNWYMIGSMDYEAGIFTPESKGRLDWGPDFYAAQSFPDHRGRRLVMGWMDRWGSRMSLQDRSWYGAMTLPRELRLTEKGELVFLPVAEAEGLRGQERRWDSRVLEDGAAWIAAGEDGQGFEWMGEFCFPDTEAGELEIAMLQTEESGEETLLRYESEPRRLVLDTCKAGIGDADISTAELPLSRGGRLRLRVYVDRSSIEVFVNDGEQVMTSRVYPSRLAGSLRFTSKGGSVSLESLSVWTLEAIWP